MTPEETPGQHARITERPVLGASGGPHGPAVPIILPGGSGPVPASGREMHPSVTPVTNPWITGVNALLVSDVMTRKVVKVSPEATLRKAAQLLLKSRVSGVPVVKGSTIVGVLSEKDIVRVMLSRIGKALLPSHLLALFLEVTAEEEARTLREVQQILDNTPVSAAMSEHPITIAADAPLDQAMRMMIQHGVHRLPVLDKDGKLVGIITRDDALRGSAGALD